MTAPGSRAIATAALLGGLLAPATGASAGEVVGAALNVVPDSAPMPDTIRVQTREPNNAALPVTPSAPGVVTALRLRHGTSGADPGVYGFRLLSGELPLFSAAPIPAVPDFRGPANAAPGFLSFVPLDEHGLPRGFAVGPGSRIAMVRMGGTRDDGLRTTYTRAIGAVRHYRLGLPDGTAQVYSEAVNDELQLQWIVEPDADGDLYGDETQDACVGVPGSCRTTLVPGPERIVQAVTPRFGVRTQVVLKAATRGRASLVLRNDNDFAVRGTLEVTTHDRFRVVVAGSASRRRVTLTRRAIDLRPGQKRTYRVALPKGIAKVLRRRKRLRVRASATVRSPAGLERTLRIRPTFRRVR